MGNLVESTFVSLDGVISDPQEYGPPYWNDEHANYGHRLLFAADALLLGRVTYEGFAEAWMQRSGDEFTERMNSMPKYVASTTMQETTWNASVLQGDTADAVAKLKADHNLLKFGTGVLDRTLIDNKLVDEFHFWMFPVVVGRGDRLLDGVIDMTHLKLVDTTVFSTGIVVLQLALK